MGAVLSYHTRASLRADLARIGVRAGDTVLLHAAMRAVGPLLNGPDVLANALLDVVGVNGTIMVYTNWDTLHEGLLDEDGRVLPEWRDHVPGFDPQASRAIRINGVIAETVRTMRGARRSGNPAASVAAIGRDAEWLTDDHPQDYGYGEGSPLAKLTQTGGRVLMIGAPWRKCTLIHHAEHLARIPDKLVVKYEVPFATPSGTLWQFIEEYETDEPVHPVLPDDHIGQIVAAFVEAGNGSRGLVGSASSLLMDAQPLVAFAVDWLERWEAARRMPD
ncbi:MULTISPECIES: aminoglycoside N(3)-acetyltransferase [unclassified Sphingomonas]|uniref:aminoglycoside 3-N-acetyltransferase n=1 Tax=unclassified Sphingomonas TaxID=196159 RepID=UPI000BCCB986|nr:MAG: aminoglycoside 3-N-acetyltransferase [Sphingomonas sp. 32-62-10]